MRSVSYTVEIDRLVFEGFGLSPDQAGRVQALVAAELRRLLAQEDAPEPRAVRQTDRLFAAPLAWQAAQGEHALAAGIAQQVAPVVQGQIKPRG